LSRFVGHPQDPHGELVGNSWGTHFTLTFGRELPSTVGNS